MNKLTAFSLSFSLLFSLTLGTLAQNKEKKPAPKVPAQSKVFITAMEGGLHSFLATEILKQGLPVTIVTEDKEADFVLVGAVLKADDKWYHTVFNGKDKNEGSVQLLSVQGKTMVWAGEAGDRSLFWGNLKRGGQRKVAERIVKQMKKDLFK